MRKAVDDVLELAADHPLIAAWLAVFFLLVLLLGGMHTCRILGRCFLVFVREFKHELEADWIVLKEIGREFRRWKSDP